MSPSAYQTQAVLNQVTLLGTVGSEPLLRLEVRPFRLSFALRVPLPSWARGGRDNVVTVIKEGNAAVEMSPAVSAGTPVLVTGALRSQNTGGAVRVWVQGLGIRRADGLRFLGDEPGSPIRRLNHVLLLGHVAREAEIHVTARGRPLMTFLVAVCLPAWTKCARPNYFKVCRWGNAVYDELPRLVKGTPVLVTGALRSQQTRGGLNDVEVHAWSIQ